MDNLSYTLVYNSERNVPMCFGEEMCDRERERERERYGLFLVNHTYAHNYVYIDAITTIHASK